MAKENIIYAKQRRKKSLAIVKNSAKITTINGITLDKVNNIYMFKAVNDLIILCNISVNIKVHGGGSKGQLDAVQGAIARFVLLSENDNNQEHYTYLKKLAKVDPRKVERKKTGRVKSRKQKPNNKR